MNEYESCSGYLLSHELSERLLPTYTYPASQLTPFIDPIVKPCHSIGFTIEVSVDFTNGFTRREDHPSIPGLPPNQRKTLHEAEALDTRDVKEKELVEAAHSAVATNDIDEAGLAEEYGKVVLVSSVKAEIEKFRAESS